MKLTDWLIITAVLLVIATLAVPRLLRSRRAAGEASAMQSVRLINSAEITYASRYPDRGFTCSLADLANPGGNSGPALADAALAGGTKKGYRFLVTHCSGEPAVSYLITAVPSAPGETGVRAFCSDQSGIIRYTSDSGTNCTANSLAIQ
jgi:type IV pilus assembly protein PilA